MSGQWRIYRSDINEHWTSKDFSIRTKTRKIHFYRKDYRRSLFEEMKTVGYTPKVAVNTSFGKALPPIRLPAVMCAFHRRLNHEADITVMPESTPVPNVTGRSLVLRNISDVKEEDCRVRLSSNILDRVVIDWRYLNNKEKETLKHESGWLGRQKLKITVDLTSGLNLYQI